MTNLISLGNDKFHAEAIVESDLELAIYLLENDATTLKEVPLQSLTVYLKPAGTSRALPFLLQAAPLPNDAQHRTSRFAVRLPEELQTAGFTAIVPGMKIDGERYLLRFQIAGAVEPQMPLAVADDKAASLYLTAAGLYSEQDIEQNGRLTAAQKYAGFRPDHDPNPTIGDIVCPITRTKADPNCSWIVGGRKYIFCCPPCIDEFVALAKQQSARILLPEEYRLTDESFRSPADDTSDTDSSVTERAEPRT